MAFKVFLNFFGEKQPPLGSAVVFVSCLLSLFVFSSDLKVCRLSGGVGGVFGVWLIGCDFFPGDLKQKQRLGVILLEVLFVHFFWHFLSEKHQNNTCWGLVV